MLSQYQLIGSEYNILINVRRSSRKSVGLEVKASGEVLVRIPAGFSDKDLKKFIEGHRQWIIKKVALVKQRAERRRETAYPPLEELTQEEVQDIKKVFQERVQYYSGRMEVTFGRITIRNQKTRWGSCSAKGNLNFNYKLYYLPRELLDYVVVHELAHRRYMNHSKLFWQEVEKYFPNYIECRKQVREKS